MTGWTLVTGGAKGIGRAIVQRLSQAGLPVVIHYNTSRDSAEQLKQDLLRAKCRVDTIQGSFATRDDVIRFIERYRHRFAATEALINNVGNYVQSPILSTSADVLYDLYQANLFAPMMLIESLAGAMKESMGGSIVNIGNAGMMNLRGDSQAAVYSSTKVALWSLTRSLARELAPFNINVNMVSPGEMENSVTLHHNAAAIPMKRPGRVEEIAEAVLYFLDPKNRYLTGQNLEVAGGLGL